MELIDGNQAATALIAELKAEVATFTGRKPCLALVRVGEDPASVSYVKKKEKTAAEIGVTSRIILPPVTITQEELFALIDSLNVDASVDGILVQSPLPKHIDEVAVFRRVSPDKDVDGFHAVNAGKLAIGMNALVPCTPLGSVYLAKMYKKDLSGLHAVVIGRSNIVGKPVAQLLLQENCTVTIVHSRTKNIADICRQADLLIAAIGKPLFVGADMVKDGAIVIDVGINRVPKPDGGSKIVGDVDFDAVKDKTAAITPVPGGVGPMTIAFLLANTLRAFELSEARNH